MTTLPVAPEDIRAAARLHAESGLLVRTPALRSHVLDAMVGAELFFKAESLQRTGSFKPRGASNFILRRRDEARANGVVTFSSGNHAQAVAMVAQHIGAKATIVMPKDAPPLKMRDTRSWGADIRLYDRAEENREAIAREIAEQSGAILVPPYDHPDIVAGQGTAALELIEDVGPLDAVFVCCGGGGLLSGCAIWTRHVCPDSEVWGAEPALGDDFFRSFSIGERVRIPQPKTIADGAALAMPGELTFAIVKALAKGIRLVPEEDMLRAMALLSDRLKLTVEPTGTLAAAAVLFGGALPPTYRRIGILISGGNVAPAMMTRALAAYGDPAA